MLIMKHVLQVHNFLTDDECNQIIDKYKSKTEDTEGYKHTGYQYCVMSCADEVDWLIKRTTCYRLVSKSIPRKQTHTSSMES